MKRYLLSVFTLVTMSAVAQTPIDVDKEFAFATQQYERMLQTHPDTTKFPQSTNPDGSIRDMKSDWWCSGFFGGSLWFIYERTKNPTWKDAAQKWTMAVAKEQYNTGTHDLGFMIYCPFGNGYKLTKNEAYVPIMLTGAKSLSTRFDPKVGLIKSWNKFQEYSYPVIIDNMMNLEFLFWAARKSGNKEFQNIAITHADNTLRNHFRPDYSSYHVICYNPDGTVAAKKTAQGAADGSAWARGQAWGLYGYTVMYRETKDKKYLDQARHIADFYLNHPNLPADKIPYWDFNAPNIPNEERDASAGAIAASALLELSTYGGPSAKTYYQSAVQMLQSLAGPAYKATLGENNNFILKHSVGHKPGKSEVDTPLIYADYYYLEGLLRYDALRKKHGAKS
ncbi:glycoside hydrolase family 88 protein [Spirosoma sp. SC4-14]|uniref:glycoside hydrolase family 88 protein n=1 Tax=Spirosoma sp. SC4-14 TaxID=3128900 RepID=UPI0030D5B658